MSDYFRGLLRLPSGVRRFLMTESLYGIGIGLYSLVLNLHLLSKGLKEDQVGALVSVGILIMGILAIPVSLLANRYGRKSCWLPAFCLLRQAMSYMHSLASLLTSTWLKL